MSKQGIHNLFLAWGEILLVFLVKINNTFLKRTTLLEKVLKCLPQQRRSISGAGGLKPLQ